MRYFFLNATVACFFAFLSGCATQRPDTRSVDTAMILPAGAERTRMKPGQKFLMPVPHRKSVTALSRSRKAGECECLRGGRGVGRGPRRPGKADRHGPGLRSAR